MQWLRDLVSVFETLFVTNVLLACILAILATFLWNSIHGRHFYLPVNDLYADDCGSLSDPCKIDEPIDVRIVN
jgi:hypothetical protein